MQISNSERVQVLVQALPYIQTYNNKTVVIKYGGNAMINDKLKDAVMTDIVLLSLVGIRVVLVHGGGPEITETMRLMGKEPKFVNGLRYTDEETIDVVQMVLAGKINKDLVRLLGTHGGKALGICGVDGGMIKADKIDTQEDLGFVGTVRQVDITVINDALDRGYTPVIATIGSDGNNTIYNINADTVAAEIAIELGAEKLVLMTDVRGLLKNKYDESSLISVVSVNEIKELRSQIDISDGMIPKINCCISAVKRGVRRTHIIDGRIPHSILLEMLSDEGVGTMFM